MMPPYTSMSYPVRGEEPVVVEALKMRALPEDGFRLSRCGVPEVALSASKPDEGPSGCRGNGDDALTSSRMNSYES